MEYWNHKKGFVGDLKTKLFGVTLIKVEEDDIGESDHKFEDMKLMLKGLLKKASPDELRAMHKLFNSGPQLIQWRTAYITLIEEIQKACA